jgi:hypothetical protein
MGKYKHIPRVEPVEPKQCGKHPKIEYEGILPKHEFSFGLIAPKGSGKTTLICNFLLHFYKGYFHRIYIFSPTIHNDEKWGVVENTTHILAPNKKYLRFLKYVRRKQAKDVQTIVLEGHPETDIDKEIQALAKQIEGDLQIPEENFKVEYTKEELQEICNERQKQIDFIGQYLPKEKRKQAKFIADRTLIICDDLVGSNLFSNSSQNNPFKELNTRHRHYSISLFIVSQAYKELPKTIRTNLTAWIFFEINNQSELDVIYEENPCGLTYDEWMHMYNQATGHGEYDFLYINHYFPKGKRLYKNFDTLLRFGSRHSSLINPPAKPEDYVKKN